ncbi:uncharacterized protein PG998_006399 [Apiospora kogelbergensis]|uniref:uncharacterized protein n=1 Tax=Apiospora kogelbergensis TaxID=1337665 RepID=UPI00313148B7
MATPTRHVPRLDWEKHKATILELYCERGLPLTRKGGSRETNECVDWTMRHQHGFAASQWQYENQLRKWRVAKNLKQDEWKSLLAEYDRLETHGHETDETSSLSRQAFIEIKQHGSWRRCTQDDLSVTSNSRVLRLEAPHPATVGGHSTIVSSPQWRASPLSVMGVSQSMLPDPFSEIYPLDVDDFFNQPFSSSNFNIDPLGLDLGLIETESDHISTSGAEMALFGSSNSPWAFSSEVIMSHDIQANSAMSRGQRHSDISILRPAQGGSLGLQQFLALAIPEESTNTADHESARHGIINYTTNRFQSLVSTKSFLSQEQRSSQPVEELFSFGGHFNTMLYSIINGLASLDDISCGPILRILSGHEGISEQLLNLLRNGPETVAKQVADNLFRAAVMSSDSQMVALLLETIQVRPSIAIDLNGRFQFGDITGITALILAVKNESEEIVEILLNAGADPEVSGQPTMANSTTSPLQFAFHQRKTDMLKKVRIINLLIKHGAAVTSYVVARIIDQGAVELPVFMAIMEGIPASSHIFIFEPDEHDSMNITVPGTGRTRSIADQIVCFIENSAATFGVKRLIDACRSTGCGKCVSDNDAMNSLLAHASRRGNLELVELIIQYATLPSNALAGAVRSGNLQLVRFLLERGARADGPPVDLFDRLQTGTVHDYSQQKTTPLAEAILQQDPRFVYALQEYGAWAQISQRDHFEPSITAAAKVGSAHYLEIIFRRAGSRARQVPFAAIVLAMEQDQFEIVLALLGTGAIHHDPLISGHLLLRYGLQKRSKQVVDALLDSCHGCDSMAYQSYHYNKSISLGFPMELACAWGDMGIISDLTGMGLPLDAGHYMTPLGVAVDSRNMDLVEHLLKLGVDPGAKAQSGWTPLAAAVRNQDYKMMDHLLSKGATPADIKALIIGMTRKDMTAAAKLRSALSERHPLGLQRFGGELMIEAIYTDNQPLIDVLIDMKVDLSSLTDWDHFRKRNQNELGLSDDEISKQVLLARMSPLGFAIIHGKCQNLQLINRLLGSDAHTDGIAMDGVSIEKHHYFCLRTPLLLAVKTGCKELIDMLLDKGADINRPARRGIVRTPLQLACEIGSYDMVQFLLQKEADASSPPAKQHGGTALQFAAKCGSMKITELLLENGADPHAPAPEFGGGNTAFGWAAEMGRYHILLLLWRMAPRDGFTTDALQRYRDLARENGHRGCVDIIDSMLDDSTFGRLISSDAERD